MEKVCTKCFKPKPATTEYFHKSKIGKLGLKPRCIDCTSIDGKNYYNQNSDRINQSHREYYQNNIEAQRARIREYSKGNTGKASRRSKKSYKRNRSKVLLRNRENSKARYISDPVYKLRLNLSKQLRGALTGSNVYTKRSRMYAIVGLTGSDLVNYLWSTFEFTYGIPRGFIIRSQVEIDHIIPKSQAKTEDEVKKLNHYTNLQLLLKEDNQIKHTKVLNKENTHE